MSAGDFAGVHGRRHRRDGDEQVQGGLDGPGAGALHADHVADVLDQRRAGLGRVVEVDHLAGDLDQEALQLALVPLLEDFLELLVGQAADVLEQVVGLGDELHVAVLDAVVDHLDEVAGAAGAAVGDAGLAVAGGLGGDLVEDRLEVLVGLLGRRRA